MADRLKTLYGRLQKMNVKLPTYDAFSSKLSDKANGEQYFNALQKAGVNIGSYEDFMYDYYGGEKNFGGLMLTKEKHDSIAKELATPSKEVAPINKKDYTFTESELENALPTDSASTEEQAPVISEEQQAAIEQMIAANKAEYGAHKPVLNTGGQFGRINLGENRNVVKSDDGSYLTESGMRYDNQAEANLEQNLVDQMKSQAYRLGRYEDQLQEGLSDVDKEIAKSKAEDSKKMSQALATGPYYGSMMRHESANTTALRKAKHDMESAQEALDEFYQQRKEGGDTHYWSNVADYYKNLFTGNFGEAVENIKGQFKHGKTGLKRIGRGFGDIADDINNWDFGVTEATQQGTLLSAVLKRDNGQPLTEQEEIMLNASALNAGVMDEVGDLGLAYKAGSTTAESLPFMIEMIVNPASGLGRASSKVLTKYAIKKYGAAEVKKHMKKYLAAKAVSRISGDIAGATAMTMTSGFAGTTAKKYENMIGRVQTAYDENGNIVYGGHTGGMSEGEAMWDSFKDRTIENWSEMSGAYFASTIGTPIKKALGSLYNRIPERVLQNDFAQWATNKFGKFAETSFAKGVNDLRKRAQIGGLFEEYLEEKFGEAMRLATDTSGVNADDFFDLEKNVETAVCLMPTQAVFGAAKLGGFRTANYKYRQDKSAADKYLQSVLGDKWTELRIQLDAAENDPSAIARIYSSMNTIGENQPPIQVRRAVMQYINAQQGVLHTNPSLYQTRINNVSVDGADGKFVASERDVNGNVIKRTQFDTQEEADAFATSRMEEVRDDDINRYLMTARGMNTAQAYALADEFLEEHGFNEMSEGEQAEFLQQMDSGVGEIGKAWSERKMSQTESNAKNANRTLASWEQSQGLNAGTVEDILNRKPTERTVAESGILDKAEGVLHDIAYPDGEFHIQQSLLDGIRLADMANLDLAGQGTDLAQGKVMDAEIPATVKAERDIAVNIATTSLQENADVLTLIAEKMGLQGNVNPSYILNAFRLMDEASVQNALLEMGDELVTESEGAQSSVLRAVIDAVNAQAKYDGFIQRTGQKIDERVEQESQRRKFHGTLNGSEPANSVVSVTDGQQTFYITNSTDGVEFSEDGTMSSTGVFAAIDGEGNITVLKGSPTLQMVAEEDLSAYQEIMRQRLQEEVSAVIEPTTEEETVEGTQPQVTESDPTPMEPTPAAAPTEMAPPPVEATPPVTEVAQPDYSQDKVIRDEEGNELYDQMPIGDTVESLLDGQLTDEQVTGVIDANIEEQSKKLESLNNKKPRIYSSRAKTIAESKKHEAEKAEIARKLAYWQNVKGEIEKITHTTEAERQAVNEELNATEEIDNGDIPNSGVALASGFIADSKIIPESFRGETGYGASEQKRFIGMIATQAKGGKTILQLAEELAEHDNTYYGGMFYGGDTNAARDAIISALQTANTRADLRANAVTKADAAKENYARRRDDAYMDEYGMSYEDYLSSEETALKDSIRKEADVDTAALFADAELEREQQATEEAAPTEEITEEAPTGPAPAETPQTQPTPQEIENARREPLRRKAREWMAKTGVNVVLVESKDEVTNEQAIAAIEKDEQRGTKSTQGWFETDSKTVYIYLPNTYNEEEVSTTFIHEVVAHKGLRELLGEENYNELCRQVFDSMSEAEQRHWLSYEGVNSKEAAGDEYIAYLAEKVDLTDAEQGIWDGIVRMIRTVLENLGITLTMSDAILSDLIKASYADMVKRSQQGQTSETQQSETDGEIRQRNTSFRIGENAETEDIETEANMGDALRFRVVDTENPTDFERKVLEDIETGNTQKVYRGMQVVEIDGQRYALPPMASKIEGEWAYGIKINDDNTLEPVLLQADEHPELAKNGKFKLDKGNGKSVPAAYNPYWHTSATMLNDQFAEAQDRPNLITVEGLISNTDLESGYKADKAKDAVGEHEWKAGTITGQLTGKRKLYLSRYFQGLRVVPDAEVAQSIYNQINGVIEYMPSNVVPPSVRAELEKLGVKFLETNNNNELLGTEHKGDKYTWWYGKNQVKNRKKAFVERAKKEGMLLSEWLEKEGRTDQLPDKEVASADKTLAKNYEKEGVRFSVKDIQTPEALNEVNDRFNTRLTELDKDRQQKDRVLHLGRPSKFLLDGGIIDAEILMEFDKYVRKSSDGYKNGHPFLADDIMNLPIAINTPIAVFDSTNGRDKVILTELKKDGKNFIVAIKTVFRRGKGGVFLEINDIATLYPKKAKGIVNWINNGLLTNVDKDKALEWLGALRTSHGTELNKQELDSAAKILQDFDNPKHSEEKSLDNPRFRIANSNQEIFVSNAERAVRNIKQEKATPQQWRAMIERQGGIKAGEDKWLGLSDWLNESDKTSLTKQEVLDFIDENKIRIEEVEYWDANSSAAFASLKEEYAQWLREEGSDYAWEQLTDRYGDDAEIAFWDLGGELAISNEEAATALLGENIINSTRLDYTTEGLENKREIALTVPTIESWNENDGIHFGDAGQGRAVAWVRFGETFTYETVNDVQEVTEFHEPYKDIFGRDIYKPEDSLKHGDLVVYGKDRDGNMIYVVYINDKLIPVAHETLEDARNAMNEYYKEHPGKLKKAHRVLVIDEIQSKRHQEGREQGYKGKEVEKLNADRTKSLEAKAAFAKTLREKYGDDYIQKEWSKEETDKFNSLQSDIDTANAALSEYEEANGYSYNKIPDAPFDKNWHELAMKRMLRLAAEEGFDKVAWTKGTQQAERYQLSAVVDHISYFENEDGTLDARAYFPEGGYEPIGKTLEEVERNVGKDIAKKMQEGVSERTESLTWGMGRDGNNIVKEYKTISGDNLKVGGEGMKGFYDDMLPRFMNKYGKKWGVKVGEVELPELEESGRTMWSVDVTPEMKESVMEGQVMFRVKDKNANNLVAMHNISEGDLRKVLETGGLIMPSIAITDVNIGFSGFGDISLLFDKETINPSDRRNKVYGGDAWTPRFPQLVPKLNKEKVKPVADKLYELLSKDLQYYFGLSSEVHSENIEDNIIRGGIASYYSKDFMKIAYLLDNGKKFKVPMKPKPYGRLSEIIIRLAKEMGVSLDDINNASYEFYENNPDFVDAIKLADADARTQNLSSEVREKVRDMILEKPMHFSGFDRAISAARSMEYDLNNGGLKQVVDGEALYEAINKKVKTDNADYNKWVDDLFDGIIEKYGIRNNKDWYTPSGNRRSWEQLYDAATPSNILRHMIAQNTQGGSGGLFDSSIFGASAEEYKSIEEIRERGKKRLHKEESDDYDEWIESVTSRISDIKNEFLTPSERNDFGSSVDANDAIVRAVAKDKTAKGIYSIMKRDYRNFTMEHAKMVADIVKEIQDKSTTYFEAKPQRIVPLSEIRKAIVPSNVDSDIIEGLQKNGIEVATYRRGNENARNRLIKKESNEIRFRKNTLNNNGEGESTQELFLSLQNKEGEDYNDTVNEIADRIVSGRARVGREDLQGRNGAQTQVSAVGEIISADRGRVSETVQQGSDASQESTRELIEKSIEDWARQNGVWMNEDEIKESSFNKQLFDEGGENRVYLSEDKSKVTKLLNPYERSSSVLDGLRNVSVFNTLFPDTAYNVVGYLRDGLGMFRIVMEQPFIQGNIYDMEEYYRNGIESKVRDMMESIGLQDEWGDGLNWYNEKYYVSDTHFGNVVEDKEGEVHIIDANAKYNEKYKKEIFGDNGFEIHDFDEGNDDIRFRFIGEQGAANMDKAEEATTRLDNLNVAREMEDAGKDAKSIKMATGWERGADKKWRYEVDDDIKIDLSANVDFRRRHPEYARYEELKKKELAAVLELGEPMTEEERKEYDFAKTIFGGDTELHRSRKLKDYVESESLFKNYPELAAYSLNIVDEMEDGALGSFNPDAKTVTLKMSFKVGEMERVLVHELQHAIQHIEGFAQGGNFSSSTKKLAEVMNIIGAPNGLPFNNLVSYLENGMETRQQHKQLLAMAEANGYDDIVDYVESLSPYGYYHRVSGEVEARNVQKRMDMTAEERRASLAQETEDVAREDQIFIYDGIERTSSERTTRFRSVDDYTEKSSALHEGIESNGLRGHLGEDNYKKMMREVFEGNDEVADNASAMLQERGWNLYDAIETFLADQAGKTNEMPDMWQNVRQSLADATDFYPTIKDTKYAMWLNKNRGIDPNDPNGGIKRNALLYRLEREERNGDMNGTEETDDSGTRFRNVAQAVNDSAARAEYERAMKNQMKRWTEEWVDGTQSVQELQRAAFGKDTQLADSRNAHEAEKAMTSKVMQKVKIYHRHLVKPLSEAINACVRDMEGKTKKDRYEALKQYMYLKHGLERNRYIFVKKAVADMDAQDRGTLLEDYVALSQQLRKDLAKGNINLMQYFAQLDNYILTNIDDTYDANNVDYSGVEDIMNELFSAYDDAQAIDYVMDVESKLGNRVNELWRRVRDVNDFALETEYRAGLLSKKNRNEIPNMYGWYIPLRGFNEETAEETYSYMNSRHNETGGSTLMEAKGRKTLADDPIATMLSIASLAIHRGERNQVKMRFYRMAKDYMKQNGQEGLISEAYVWEELVKETDENGNEVEVWKAVFPDIDNAKPKEIAGKLERFNKDMERKKAAGTARKNYNRGAVNKIFESQSSFKEHMVKVYINGDEHILQVNGNPRAAQSLNGTLGRHHHKMLTSAWKKIQRAMSQMFTSLNPTFALVANPLRDFQSALMNTIINDGMGAGLMFIGDYAKNMTNIIGYSRMFKLYEDKKLDMNKREHRMFKEFCDNGGITGFIEPMTVENYKDMVNGLLHTDKMATVGMWKDNTVAFLSQANNVMENMSRFATYKAARRRGLSIQKSIKRAKDYSINFNQRGLASGEGLAGGLAKAFNMMYLFVNPTMQAFGMLSKNLKNHPVKTGFYQALLPVFTAGVYVPTANLLLASLLDGDDDEYRESYAVMPEWVRRNNICLYAGNGNFVKIPLPIELRAFYGLGEIAFSEMLGDGELGRELGWDKMKSDRNVGMQVADLLLTLSPLSIVYSGGGVDSGWDLFWTAMPQVVKPISEIARNKSWTGAPIYNDSEYAKHLPEWQKAFSSTNPYIVDFCRWLDETTGGDGVKAGKINMNPAKINHFVKGYFGGLYTTVDEITSIGKIALAADKDLEKTESGRVPLLKAVWYEYDEAMQFKRYSAKYYKYIDEAEETKHYLDEYVERGNVDGAMQIIASPKYERMKILDAYRSSRQKLSKAIATMKSREEETTEETLKRVRLMSDRDIVLKLDSIK